MVTLKTNSNGLINFKKGRKGLRAPIKSKVILYFCCLSTSLEKSEWLVFFGLLSFFLWRLFFFETMVIVMKTSSFVLVTFLPYVTNIDVDNQS